MNFNEIILFDLKMLETICTFFTKKEKILSFIEKWYFTINKEVSLDKQKYDEYLKEKKIFFDNLS